MCEDFIPILELRSLLLNKQKQVLMNWAYQYICRHISAVFSPVGESNMKRGVLVGKFKKNP